jgi:regulator of RNase E activity RraA
VIIADGDGVMVIPPGLLVEAVAGAKSRGERERVYKARINAGEHIVDVVGLRDTLNSPMISRREMIWTDDPEA